MSRSLNKSIHRRTVSTFSRDIACAVSLRASVAGLSVLLRERHGFEGSFLVLEEPVPHDLAVVQPPGRGTARINLDSVPSSEVRAVGDDNVVPDVDESLRPDIDLLEEIEPLHPEAPDLFDATVN